VNTFFIQVVPGVPDTYTVSGYAKARVQRAAADSIAAQAPFIICGDSALDVTNDPDAKVKDVSQWKKIYSGETTPFKINPDAVGRIFRVHDEQLDQHQSGVDADCGLDNDNGNGKGTGPNKFMGLADWEKNAGKSTPGWFYYYPGNRAGPVRTQVTINGVEGCKANESPSNCVMLIPVAVKRNAGDPSGQFYVIGYAAFKITQVGANSHNAQLLDDYIISGVGGSDTWCRECGGTVVIRLIW
jgi:hypothetical protein